MTLRRQLALCWIVLMLSAGLAGASLAQRQDHNTPRPRQESRPARMQNSAPRQQPRQQRSEPRREQAPVARGARPYSGSANTDRALRNSNGPSASMDHAYDRPGGNRPNPNLNRQNSDRPDFNHGVTNPNRPPSSQYSRSAENNYGGYREQQNRLSPEDRQRVIQNQQRFRQLSPQQQPFR